MKLVVGLGNPGQQYAQTRHNVGFWVLDQLGQTNSAGSWSHQFDGQVTDCLLPGEKMVLLKPMTFMNRSGIAVRKAVDFYKLPIDQVLIVCDDLALPLGKLRFRPNGSSGGQNGLKDIFAHLGTQEVARLRLGIGNPGRLDPAQFVLSDFRTDERPIMDDAVIDAGRAVECWATQGIATAMNRFNGNTKET